jgi:hypothetical protein
MSALRLTCPMISNHGFRAGSLNQDASNQGGNDFNSRSGHLSRCAVRLERWAEGCDVLIREKPIDKL